MYTTAETAPQEQPMSQPHNSTPPEPTTPENVSSPESSHTRVDLTEFVYPEEWQCFRENQQRALAVLSLGGMVKEAAAAAGVDRSRLWQWKKQSKEYEAAWEEAMEKGTDQLEEVLDLCAKAAAVDPRYQNSLHFALINRRPGKWKLKRDSVDVTIRGQIDLRAMEPDELLRMAEAGAIDGLTGPRADGLGGAGCAGDAVPLLPSSRNDPSLTDTHEHNRQLQSSATDSREAGKDVCDEEDG